MVNKKAIILLVAPYIYDLQLPELKKSILTCCNQNNLEVINVITSGYEYEYDYEFLYEFIQTMKEQDEPIALVLNQGILALHEYIPAWCAIGTLSAVGMVDEIFIHKRSNRYTLFTSEVVTSLKRSTTDFLAESISHFQDLVIPTKEKNC